MKANLNFQDVSKEICNILDADLARLAAIYGNEAIDYIMELPKENMPIMKNMQVMFDYVVEARISRNYELCSELEDLTDFFLSVVPNSSMIDLYRSEPIEGICALIVDTAEARWGLDFEKIGSFSIRRIARLANMDERSVRNAANPKLADPLITYRDTDGSTKVAYEDAVRWLEGRRSYKKTTFIDETSERDLIKDSFKNLLDLAQFIIKKAYMPSQQFDNALLQAGLLNEYKSWIGQTPYEPVAFNINSFKLLADSIAIKPEQQKDFIFAACKVLQTAELSWLEQQLQK